MSYPLTKRLLTDILYKKTNDTNVTENIIEMCIKDMISYITEEARRYHFDRLVLKIC